MGQTSLYAFLENVGRGTASGEQPAALHMCQHRHMHCVLHLWGLPVRSNEHVPNLCRIARGSGARVALQPAVLLAAVAQQPNGAPLVWRLRFVKRAGGSMTRIGPKGHNTRTWRTRATCEVQHQGYLSSLAEKGQDMLPHDWKGAFANPALISQVAGLLQLCAACVPSGFSALPVVLGSW